MKKFFKTIKVTYMVVGVIILLLLIGRLLLPGIVRNYVNKRLNELPGYTGHVQDIDIALIRGAYVIKRLELKKKTDPAKYPFLRIERSDLSIEWGALFKGRLVGEVELDEPVVYMLQTERISKEPSRDSWTATVKALMPFKINHLQVNNGRFAYLDFSKKPNVNLHIDHMQLSALNLANVQKKGDRLPSTVNLSGIAVGEGHLKADMKVNVLKDIPDFDLSLQLTHVNLLSLNSFMEANAKFDIERGNLDVFTKLALQNSEMEGYFKPFINNLKVLDVKKDIRKKGGPLRVVKKAVIGLFAKVVTNPKTKKIATIAVIKGNIKDLKTSPWETFLNILKNAFIKAFHESLQNELEAEDPGEQKTK